MSITKGGSRERKFLGWFLLKVVAENASFHSIPVLGVIFFLIKMLPYGSQMGATSVVIYTNNLKTCIRRQDSVWDIHYCAGSIFAGKDPLYPMEKL